MIAKFRPTPRAVTMASAALFATLLCLTFTRAADPVKPAEVPQPKPASEMTKRERGIRILERELKKLDERVAVKQAEVDRLKIELGITDVDVPGGAPIEQETLRKLDAQRIEAQADYARMQTFYRALTNMSHRDLKQAISTASPDTQLADLFTQLHMESEE